MTLSNHNVCYAISRGKIAVLNKHLAKAFLDFPGKYGYARQNKEFGSIDFLQKMGHTNILKITKVELLEIK